MISIFHRCLLNVFKWLLMQHNSSTDLEFLSVFAIDYLVLQSYTVYYTGRYNLLVYSVLYVEGRCNYILCMLQPLFSDTNGSMASLHAILFVIRVVAGYCYIHISWLIFTSHPIYVIKCGRHLTVTCTEVEVRWKITFPPNMKKLHILLVVSVLKKNPSIYKVRNLKFYFNTSGTHI